MMCYWVTAGMHPKSLSDGRTEHKIFSYVIEIIKRAGLQLKKKRETWLLSNRNVFPPFFRWVLSAFPRHTLSVARIVVTGYKCV